MKKRKIQDVEKEEAVEEEDYKPIQRVFSLLTKLLPSFLFFSWPFNYVVSARCVSFLCVPRKIVMRPRLNLNRVEQ